MGRGGERDRDTSILDTSPLAVGNMGDKDGGRGGGWRVRGGSRGYKGQVHLEVFLPDFVYHKESHAGHLLLAVLNQNTYSLVVCQLSPVEPSGLTDDSHALVTPRPLGGHCCKNPAGICPAVPTAR